MTKTEELKKTMVDILLNYPQKGVAVPVGRKADVILKACKEAGLAFVVEDAELPKVEKRLFRLGIDLARAEDNPCHAKSLEVREDKSEWNQAVKSQCRLVFEAGFRQFEEIDLT